MYIVNLEIYIKNEIIIDFSKFWKYMALNIIIEEMEK